LLFASLASGCFASHEPTAAVEPDPLCCRDGTFEVLDGLHRGTLIDLDSCSTDRWRCTVDGVERYCGAGHGSLMVRLTEESGGPWLSIYVVECLGPEVTATIDAETVTLRRLAP
jgi:hypothetical protein